MREVYRSTFDVFVNNIIRNGRKGVSWRIGYAVLKNFANERRALPKVPGRSVVDIVSGWIRIVNYDEETVLKQQLALEKKKKDERMLVPVVKLDMIVFSVAPGVRIKQKRRGTKLYNYPKLIDINKRKGLVYRWALSVCKGKTRGSLKDKLYKEVLKMRKGEGEAVRKRDVIYKRIVGNIPFIQHRK